MLSSTLGAVKNSYTSAHIAAIKESQPEMSVVSLLGLLTSIKLRECVWEEKQKFPATSV